MTAYIVSITDTEEMAKTLDRYIRCFLGTQVDSFFMTYQSRTLSSDLYRQADLFVLDLFRHDDIGIRAEAIPVAEKWAAHGKKLLIISGAAKATEVGSPNYWDMASSDLLHERIGSILSATASPIAAFNRLKQVFAEYCRPPSSHHHHHRS